MPLKYKDICSWHERCFVRKHNELYNHLKTCLVLSMKKNDRQLRIQSVAQEISRYIDKRPNAAETVEGVTSWWISRQRIEESVEVVENALEYLVAQKTLVKRSLGRRTLYMKAK